MKKDRCKDCGVIKSPGYAHCLTCGSNFEEQKNRTHKEQRKINKKIRERNKLRKKEFRQRNLNNWKERQKDELREDLPCIIISLCVCLITGSVGSFIGETFFNNGGWGFLIGFLLPILIATAIHEFLYD